MGGDELNTIVDVPPRALKHRFEICSGSHRVLIIARKRTEFLCICVRAAGFELLQNRDRVITRCVLGVRSRGSGVPDAPLGVEQTSAFCTVCTTTECQLRPVTINKVCSTGARPSTRPSIMVLMTGTAANARHPPHRVACCTDERGAN